MIDVGKGAKATPPRTLASLTANQAAAKRQSAANSGGSGSYGAGNAKPTALAKSYNSKQANYNPKTGGPAITSMNGRSAPTPLANMAISALMGGVEGAAEEAAPTYDPTPGATPYSPPYVPNSSGSGRDRGWAPAATQAEAYSQPAPTAAAIAESVTTPMQNQAPEQVFQVARGDNTSDLVGPAMMKSGQAGTFGQFDRQRRQRGPSTGLSMTPEELQRTAARRLG